MTCKVRYAIVAGLIVGFCLAALPGPAGAQEPSPPVPLAATPEFPPELLTDDIMPAPKAAVTGGAPPSLAATDYLVIPILFVPAGLTPAPAALSFIDQSMQSVQRWYARQLRRQTFNLEPARLVRGSHPLAYYYNPCFPPTSSCSFGYSLWNNVFAELATSGYGWTANQVIGVFFQHNGVGGTALGGGNFFLVSLDNYSAANDCTEQGCAHNIGEGATAHELGHAFGLPHTADDAEGSPGKSVMSYGFYGYPRTTLVNNPVNPERDFLATSPFFNVSPLLKDGGFEDCLAAWKGVSGGPSCTPDSRSGLLALQLSRRTKAQLVEQQVSVKGGETYDFSAWLHIFQPTGDINFQARIVALSAAGDTLATFIAGEYTGPTAGWERLAQSVTMPAGTTKARIQFYTPALGARVDLDDVHLNRARRIPPQPWPMALNNGDAVPTLRPQLQWTETVLATSFHLQVATDPFFKTLVTDAVGPSPFYTLPANLENDRQYFWRVKGRNGAGESEWSLPWSFIPRSGATYYSDEFETGTLGSEWAWQKEDKSAWNFGGPLNRRNTGYIGIVAQAGDLTAGSNNAKNLLLRDTPAGNFEASTTCDFWPPPNTNFQQGGLLIYQDDDNYIKLVEMYDGYYRLRMLAEVNGAVVRDDSSPAAAPLPVKISRNEHTYTAYYSPDGLNWRQIGQPLEAAWLRPKMGLGAWSVVNVERITAYFDWFRVTTYPTVNRTFLPLTIKAQYPQ